MPVLVTNISAKIYDHYKSDIQLVNTIETDVQFEDYIKIFNFEAYLQNFSRIFTVSNLQKPQFFGLKNQYNVPMITIEISY